MVLTEHKYDNPYTNCYTFILVISFSLLNIYVLKQVKDFQYKRCYFWGGTEIKVWFGKVEGLSVYFLEPQNG